MSEEMNRQEILKKSQLENRGKDIAYLEITKSSLRIALIVIVCLVYAVGIVEMIVYDVKINGLTFSVAAGITTSCIYRYVKLRRKKDLLNSIVWGIAAILQLIIWIIYLQQR
ncbi:MAG: hypothetical protein IJS53_04960 [Clostridia bacterium]|nr:hypothetical protein [Clostridia bacterium]